MKDLRKLALELSESYFKDTVLEFESITLKSFSSKAIAIETVDKLKDFISLKLNIM
jgi:hypothetical protein